MVRVSIKSRNILSGFSDAAGAKAVLGFLSTSELEASSITLISDRKHRFYEMFNFVVHDCCIRTNEEWLANKDLLICGTSYPPGLELDLIDTARHLNIESVSIVDHWTNFYSRYDRNGRLVLPDTIYVIDERAKQLAVDSGLPSNIIKVAGNPYHKYLELWKPKKNRAEYLADLGLRDSDRYVVYAPEPLSIYGLKSKYGFDEFDALKFINSSLELLNSIDFTLVVKAHPNHPDWFYEKIYEILKHKKTICVTECDFEGLVLHSSAVMGLFSNALIEANIIGAQTIRPLPQVNDAEYDYIDPLGRPEWVVRSVEGLVRILKNCLKSKSHTE